MPSAPRVAPQFPADVTVTTATGWRQYLLPPPYPIETTTMTSARLGIRTWILPDGSEVESPVEPLYPEPQAIEQEPETQEQPAQPQAPAIVERPGRQLIVERDDE